MRIDCDHGYSKIIFKDGTYYQTLYFQVLTYFRSHTLEILNFVHHRWEQKRSQGNCSVKKMLKLN